MKITDYTEQGFGHATWVRQDGQSVDVEVPYTIASEEVEGTVFKQFKKRGYRYRAKDLVILKSSPQRITPRCTHFGFCGGCTFQHMSYEEQLRLKEQKIRTLFSPLLTGVTFHPILAAPSLWNYRNKMEFTFGQDREGKRYLGLIQGNSKGRVFNLQECFLTDPWAVEALHIVKKWQEECQISAYSPRSDQGSLRTLTVRIGQTSGDKMVILTVSGKPEYALSKSNLQSFVEALQPISDEKVSIVLRIHQAIKGQPTQMFEMMLQGHNYFREYLSISTMKAPLEFRISPHAFFQPNTMQAMALYEKTLDIAKLESSMTLCDLYCGIGSFGMLAAHRVKEVVGIELDHDAAYDARVNSERLGITNFTVHRGDVPEVLKTLSLKPDVVIVDPPRSGLGLKAISEIDALKPSTLMYVSCNPATQAQDAQELVERGYTILDIAPVDQFPQTPHVENIVRFVKI